MLFFLAYLIPWGFTHSDQVSLSIGCLWGFFLISFHHNAGCSPPDSCCSSFSFQAEESPDFWQPQLGRSSGWLPETEGLSKSSCHFPRGAEKVEWEGPECAILWPAVTSPAAAASCLASESEKESLHLQPLTWWGSLYGGDGQGRVCQSGSRSSRLQVAVGSPMLLVSHCQSSPEREQRRESNWCANWLWHCSFFAFWILFGKGHWGMGMFRAVCVLSGRRVLGPRMLPRYHGHLLSLYANWVDFGLCDCRTLRGTQGSETDSSCIHSVWVIVRHM